MEERHIITTRLMRWYDEHKRDLPWRETTDPYFVWLSEVILQQTRVDQGLSYFLRFVQHYPQITDLAAAPEDDVLKLWQGLGYYSRARNLHAAARMVVEKYNSEFPNTYKEILSLRGVGEYTASAISSISFNLPYAVVDGNVYRVLSRLFAIDEFIDTTKGKKCFSEIAQSLLDVDRPGCYNQAIMDFGALQCVPVNPDCNMCCMSDICLAFAENKVSEFPKKAGEIKVRNRYFNYLDIRVGKKMYIQKRTEKDIWQNLYELPLIETESELNIDELLTTEAYNLLFDGVDTENVKPSIKLKHILPHQRIFASFYQIHISSSLIKSNLIEIQSEDVDEYAVSRLIEKYLEQIS